MKSNIDITPKILSLCTAITRALGQNEGLHVSKPEPKLRRLNRVKTIQASLAIEGNTLSLDKVTAILDGKRVLGSQREILEVQNAIRAYDLIPTFKPFSSKSLCEAHGALMKGLIPDAGKWRKTNVGIFQGERVAHVAPQAKRVPELMESLFAQIKTDKETHALILSALFRFELEFIHPFSDGNGRVGRLWQTILLSNFHPLFEFTPIESVLRSRQRGYFDSLSYSDKKGNAGPFIEFSLRAILDALETLGTSLRPLPLMVDDRLEIAHEKFGSNSFSRKEYLALFKTISTATASRDLAYGVEKKKIKRHGEKALARYRFVSG